MPAELLEQEAEVAEVPREISKPGTVQQTAVNTVEPQTASQRTAGKKSIWREIFEGHEDLLGWTPD